MKIKQFKATGVHGDLKPITLNFEDRLTFLTGINGSGKTSVIKLMIGLLGPSLEFVNRILFESVEVTVDYEEQSYKVIAVVRDDEKVRWSLERNDKEMGHFVSKYLYYDQVENPDETHYYEYLYREHRRFRSSTLFDLISQIPTPRFLGLDRRLYSAGQVDAMSMKRFRDRERRIGYTESARNTRVILESAVQEAQQLVHNYVRKTAQKQPAIIEDLKQKILMSSFSYETRFESFPDNGVEEKLKELNAQRERFVEAIRELNIPDLQSQIVTFFEKIEKLLNDFQKGSKTNRGNTINTYRQWFINNTQLKRVEEIIEFIEEYQAKVKELREPIARLSDLINRYYSESGKSVDIQGDGTFQIKKRIGVDTDIMRLSSGEKHILIMLTHLVFFFADNDEHEVVIIDEPELSLHLTWQEIFVDSILAANENTQFVLATHSPMIIGDESRLKLCRDLTDYAVE